MTRVIAGEAGGRRLAVPPGTTTRPTSDRAREGLFASLLSELGTFDGRRVLDLYAGSGAIGLEALSRGAGQALLVESDARAAAVIKANVATVAPGMPTAATFALITAAARGSDSTSCTRSAPLDSASSPIAPEPA